MKKHWFFILVMLLFVSCKSEHKEDVHNDLEETDSLETVAPEIDSLVKKSISKYDLSTVDKENSKEFMENLVKIEKEFGEQWSFCDCVVKGDSINKAFSTPNLSDAEFDRLSDRFDYIDSRCKAFRIQNPNATPEERAEHEKKVKKCLKEAGIR